jgi:hypothetical protein
MSTPCRLAIGAARAVENTAAPQIARRTLSTSSISSSRAQFGKSAQCLRNAQISGARSMKPLDSFRGQARSFTQSASRNKLKTIDQIRARNKGGVCAQSSFHSRIQEKMLPKNRSHIDMTISLSTSQQPSSSSQPAAAYMPTSHTRKSAWRESG